MILNVLVAVFEKPLAVLCVAGSLLAATASEIKIFEK